LGSIFLIQKIASLRQWPKV